MKTSPMHLTAIGVLLAGSLLAQTPATPPGWQSMKILRDSDPIYPRHLIQVGVDEGSTRVLISTGADGKLSEWLVLGYTHPEFAEAAVGAIRQWKFEPARLEGQPVGTVVQLDFDFSAQGCVVSTSYGYEIAEARALRIGGDRYISLACPAKALDHALTPVVYVAPRYPAALAKQGTKGTVCIDFYIDELGSVRLPSVSVEQDADLAQLAVDAIRQWKFTPPTSHGRPVLVKARQEFRFGAGS